MKKIAAVLLSLVMLLSVAACGTASSSVVEETQAEKLTKIFRGIYVLEERDGAYGDIKEGGGVFIPLRFSAERLEDYENYPEIPYSKCTTGVRMDFYTDAAEIGFRFSLTDSYYDGAAGYPNDYFDIYENGEFKESVLVSSASTVRELTYARQSSEAESRITIVFPIKHGVALSEVELGNARPYEAYDHKILFLGDSITQGLFGDKPSDNYVDQVCLALNADYMNLAVGGEVYRFDALDEDVPYQPDHIVVALGTNDWHRKHSVSDVANDCNQYFNQLTQIYPGIPVTVITPFEQQGDTYVAAYTEQAENYGLHVIDGRTLIPAEAENFHPDGVHPSTKGFSVLAENLLPLLKEHMGI